MSSDAAIAASTGGGVAQGLLIAVVGASGAGKDSLMTYARERLGADPAVLFVRRAITRPARIDAEDHDSLSVDAFLAAQASGAFAVAWEAHGLHYAIPATAHRHLAAGGVAVINGRARPCRRSARCSAAWLRSRSRAVPTFSPPGWPLAVAKPPKASRPG
ncbi:hypothetical protein [Pseudaminobacter sp. NGMCC 1.201702]|uniref:hypothetical protein n=1 Tax=Pseudaminobacter sp. NGMCC 1.201702 TaxID=3391825 RepID=UPI0039EE734A